MAREDTFRKKTLKKDPVAKSNNRSRVLVAGVGVGWGWWLRVLYEESQPSRNCCSFRRGYGGGCCPGVVVGADSRVRTCSETDEVKKTVSPGFLQAQDSGPH